MNAVDICNLALGHLGDTANIASLDERSRQAQLSKRFYPVALKAALEMGSWGFATRRVKLALVANPTKAIAQAVDPTLCGTWRFAYAMPAGVINVLAVLRAEATSDYEERFVEPDRSFLPYPQGYVPIPDAIRYTPQPYAAETAADGSQIILTNACDAVLRYTVLVEDATKFSGLFVVALSWLLASMLAGPLLKGDAGEAAGERCLKMFESFESEAEASDANQRKNNIEPAVSWIKGR